ncbi:uncharacterized protein ACLA_017420 [Aspergillus clavatus NRRL 1]|uniref:Uncharacterized protein n=1 Tax=Aspergillus clavatus (strain ATCC 1007 / CBS 513.65 / DSM 816 / NCTC 3887 / NRRL 1 / QM 1276 / 107) TaxID=344612 RepID=A1CC27_ASPCL|nr:uncharacterized protein ACLA_017420 [Aspergillus clavatus NRRL 1]EAW13295.1 conserved hypothetical protein [Aspergillus clavatus NRRL 1]
MGSNTRELFHILLTTSHLNKNPNNVIEKVRIPGSYTSLQAAKAAAYSCLFAAGYEKEWFTSYETKPELFESNNLPERSGLAVYAVAPDGTEFRVHIITTPVDAKLADDVVEGHVTGSLYYVVQADVEYDADEGSRVRDIDIEGVFRTYQEARELASKVLLSKEGKITKDSFAAYTEAEPNEKDCGYGENVIVRAVSDYGTNYLISVVKNQGLESVSLAEAAMKIL